MEHNREQWEEQNEGGDRMGGRMRWDQGEVSLAALGKLLGGVPSRHTPV